MRMDYQMLSQSMLMSYMRTPFLFVSYSLSYSYLL